jgi:cholesterol transport system auxiliary component
MKQLSRTFIPVALAAALAGCSLGGMLGGGGAPPTMLLDLTPAAADPGQISRTANAGQAVTIAVPVIAKELRTVRVPVQVSPTDVEYVANAQWVDTPDRLFQDLLAETLRRTTNRVVLDPRQVTLDPGLMVSGELRRFGYDAATGQVIVEYDGALATPGGARVETRRFSATAPSDGTAASVGPALNSAANEVATEVANWIGNTSS